MTADAGRGRSGTGRVEVGSRCWGRARPGGADVLGHLVNPVLELSDEEQCGPEGCLSIPEHYAEVTRPAQVRMRWTGLDGASHVEEFEGLWATCAQHELDHLNGKLFVDYVSRLKRDRIRKKLEKVHRARA